MARHPRLLGFPVISLLAFTLLSAFLLLYMLFHVSAVQVWQAIHSEEARTAIVAAIRASLGSDPEPARNSPGAFAAYHLTSMLIANFINVAFYSQIMEVMSGGRARVARGFGLAGSKLGPIIAWSLVAGLLSALLGALQEGSGLLMAISMLATVVWTMASLFVIPVMINEPRTRRLDDYIRISILLLRRVWAESVIGFVGMFLVAVVIMIGLMMLNIFLLTSHRDVAMTVMPAVSMTASLGVGALFYLATQIFLCGLYVYATQGVVPDSFDDDIPERVWTLKDPLQGPAAPEDPAPVRPTPARRIWPAVTATVLGAASLWLAVSHFNQQSSLPTRPQPPLIGRVGVDLAELGYALTLDDVQAAGLFAGKNCAKCDFSAAGTWVQVGEKRSEGLSVWMARSSHRLYFFFHGTDEAAGQQLIAQIVAGLRTRFPGHDGSIDRVDDVPYIPRTTVARWDAVPGAASYTVEIDCFHCCGPDQWCTEVGSKWKIVPDLKETTYSFDWVGAQPGRWRVHAVDAGGRKGPKSGWTDFDYSM